jgi:uncharacterized protein YukE
MTEMLYDHGAGDALAQAFKAQAQALHEHADELLRTGTALVNEHLHGAAAEAFHQSLTVHTNSAKQIAETIHNHSNAVLSSFHGMHSTDVSGAQSMSI